MKTVTDTAGGRMLVQVGWSRGKDWIPLDPEDEGYVPEEGSRHPVELIESWGYEPVYAEVD